MSLQEHVPDGTFVKEIAALVHPVPKWERLTDGRQVLVFGKEFEVFGQAQEPAPIPLNVSTLQAVVDYYNSGLIDVGSTVVQVASPSEVWIVAPLANEQRQQFTYLYAKANTPGLALNTPLDMERFIIQLQTMFGPTEDRRRVLEFVGSLTAGLAAEIADDGVSQSVTTRKGITRAGEPVKFENPVLLSPFRTFAEIEQPVSEFILRLNSKGDAENRTAVAALYEADGGAWKREAITWIGDWLRERLPEVTVLA